MPAQFTASVRLPNFALACSTAALTSASFDTSVLMNSARSPSFSCAALPASSLTSSMATKPPAFTSFSATAKPRPDTPPLTMALAFSNFICFSRYLDECRRGLYRPAVGGSGRIVGRGTTFELQAPSSYVLRLAFHHLPRDLAQHIRLRPEAGERIQRGIKQLAQPLPRGFHAEQGGEGRLAVNGIAARRLAQGRAVAFHVQQVVAHLEGEPDEIAVVRERPFLAAIERRRQRRAHEHGGLQQPAGLEAVDGLQLFQADGDMLGRKVQGLAAGQAARAARAGKQFDEAQPGARVGGQVAIRGEQVEGEHLQGVADQDGGGLVE